MNNLKVLDESANVTLRMVPTMTGMSRQLLRITLIRVIGWESPRAVAGVAIAMLAREIASAPPAHATAALATNSHGRWLQRATAPVYSEGTRFGNC